MNTNSKTEFLQIGGLPIVCSDRGEMAAQMLLDFEEQASSKRIRPPKLSFSVNGQILASANADAKTLRLFRSADYLDADGMWVIFASRLLCRHPLTERIATTDFFHDCARVAQEHGISFFLLGSTPDTNAQAQQRLSVLYPNLRIAGSHHGFFPPDQIPLIAQSIKDSGADVVWVGMGHPRQEIVARELGLHLAGVTWIKTCGGLFEHIIEAHPRAPRWVQSIGFEWLHRMLQEPKRLTARYVMTNLPALWHLATKTRRQRFSRNSNGEISSYRDSGRVPRSGHKQRHQLSDVGGCGTVAEQE